MSFNKMDLAASGPHSNTCNSLQKFSFGLGHMYNDLCAAMWFSYTLFYFQYVLLIESKIAGILLMIGQVIDALSTPIAGWVIDYSGKKRIWHFIGTIAVAVGFLLLFSLNPASLNGYILLTYSLVITLFQIGWAMVQISHLSIIPEISRSHSHSSDLTAIRYTASVCCSISVYIITLIILESNGETNTIGPADFYKFKEIALIISFIGLLASVLFYCGILGLPESNLYEFINGTENEDANNLGSSDKDKHFLKSSVIYIVSLIYMASRLFTTLNLIYIPLYIAERADLEGLENDTIRQTIATIPLVSYVASFLTSIFLHFRIKWCNDKDSKSWNCKKFALIISWICSSGCCITSINFISSSLGCAFNMHHFEIIYFFGSLFGLAASIWVAIGVPITTDTPLYCIAAFLGISGSATMIASLCLTANFVKINGYGGGKVYSIVTFTDKLISGGVVFIVQNMQCVPRSLCPNYYEHVVTYICGSVSLLGLFALAILQWKIKSNGKK